MAKGGRNRLSVARHKLQGTYQKSRHGKRAAPAGDPCDPPPAPEYLSEHEAHVWDDLCEQLRQRGTFRPHYRSALVLLAKTITKIHEGRSNMASYAFSKLVSSANEQLRAFGLGPIEAEAPPERELDPVEEFLFGGRSLAQSPPDVRRAITEKNAAEARRTMNGGSMKVVQDEEH